MDIVCIDGKGACVRPSWLSRNLALLVWGGTIRNRLLVAAPILAVLLSGASLLLAGVPASRSVPARRALPLAHEEFAPPMVRLLEDMQKAGAIPAEAETPAGVREINLFAGPIAAPFLYRNVGLDRDRALTCLATAGWYEAGNDLAGQRAVMQVVLNRVRHPSFPKSVCGVVFQGSERATGCQFSFTCDGSMTRRIPSPGAWAQVRMLAEGALSGAVDADVREATHFHADYVSPWWASKLEPIVKVGAHIFYRWAGARGALGPGNAATAGEALPAVALAETAYSARPDAAAAALPVLPAANGGLAGVPRLRDEPLTELVPGSRLALRTGPVDAVAAGPAQRPASTLMPVDPASPSGRWAVSAMERCGDGGPCRVIAYGQAGPGSNAPGDNAAGVRPLFLFVRDSAGMQLALWDCDRAPRPRQDQCMPSGAELAALVEGR